MDRLINVFIGGSSEGLSYAKKIKNKLEEKGTVQCTIWNKDIFEFNNSFLESLSKASMIFDFGILIATKDDVSLVRNNLEDTPRDNVVFEYGLFLGAMGNNRTYLIQEDGCKLPTDLLGYTTPRIKKGWNDTKWTTLIDPLYENMIEQFNKSEIQLLPSTSLAIGYFNSFIRNATTDIFNSDGCTLKKSNVHYNESRLKILIPNDLSSDIGKKAQIYFKKASFKQDEIGSTGRPFSIRYFKEPSDDKLVIVDIPTTLNAIRPSIDLLVPDRGLGENSSKLKLERKELENFKKTIDYLISQDDYAKDLVVTEWNDLNI